MWVGAGAGVAGLWYLSPASEPDRTAHRLDGVPTRTPESNRANQAVRRELPTEAAPLGRANTFRGGWRNHGRSEIRGPARAHPVWHFATHGRISAQAVVDSQGRIYIGSHDRHFYALTARGKLRWRRDLGGPIYSTAAIGEDGRLYVGSDANRLVAMRPDGTVDWTLDTEAEADTGITLSRDGGRLYVAAGSYLLAVALDGSVQWRFRTGSKIYSTPALDDDGTIYVGSQDDHLYALDADGFLRWSYRTGGDVDSSPAIGDRGFIYFGSDDGAVYALDRDGVLRWSRPLGGYVRAPVGLTGTGDVIASVFGPRPRIVALDQATGDVRWSFAIRLADSSEVGTTSGPSIDLDGNIYFGGHDDYLYSVTSRGRLRWVFPAAGDFDASPVLRNDGTLLVGSDDGKLYALRGS